MRATLTLGRRSRGGTGTFVRNWILQNLYFIGWGSQNSLRLPLLPDKGFPIALSTEEPSVEENCLLLRLLGAVQRFQLSLVFLSSSWLLVTNNIIISSSHPHPGSHLWNILDAAAITATIVQIQCILGEQSAHITACRHSMQTKGGKKGKCELLGSISNLAQPCGVYLSSYIALLPKLLNKINLFHDPNIAQQCATSSLPWSPSGATTEYFVAKELYLCLYAIVWVAIKRIMFRRIRTTIMTLTMTMIVRIAQLTVDDNAWVASPSNSVKLLTGGGTHNIG